MLQCCGVLQARLFESWVADPVTAISAIAALLVVTIGIFGEQHILQVSASAGQRRWTSTYRHGSSLIISSWFHSLSMLSRLLFVLVKDVNP